MQDDPDSPLLIPAPPPLPPPPHHPENPITTPPKTLPLPRSPQFLHEIHSHKMFRRRQLELECEQLEEEEAFFERPPLQAVTNQQEEELVGFPRGRSISRVLQLEEEQQQETSPFVEGGREVLC